MKLNTMKFWSWGNWFPIERKIITSHGLFPIDKYLFQAAVACLSHKMSLNPQSLWAGERGGGGVSRDLWPINSSHWVGCYSSFGVVSLLQKLHFFILKIKLIKLQTAKWYRVQTGLPTIKLMIMRSSTTAYFPVLSFFIIIIPFLHISHSSKLFAQKIST